MVLSLTPLHTGSGLVPGGSRVEVFAQIFRVFVALGTLVGVVVVAYMLYNAYAYRRSADAADEDAVERPKLGEAPRGSGGGKKLALSLSLSAIIVVSLIAWTFFTLLYVESGAPAGQGEALDVTVVGYQFGWEFIYPDGTTTRTLHVPADRPVELHVTSRDVFHNFGIPAFRVKSDAIPGHSTDTWFIAEETGTYTANCYELCGAGHSFMTAPVVVEEQAAFQQWYANTTES